MLSDILDNKKILLHIEAVNWEEAIDLVAKPLLDGQYIIQDYIDAMKSSVKKYGAYIVIAKGVALAHARSEDGVKSMGLSVATLQSPIDFGNPANDPVKLVFCLAAPDSTAHLGLMRSLVNVINEEDKINELVQAADIQQFRAALNKFDSAD